MGKPRLIILIRHAQSEGNKNREIHQLIPDHRVKLTDDGWKQAEDAGRRLRALLRPDDTLQVFTSPYRRTRETTEGILRTLTAQHDPDASAEGESTPSPFSRNNIKVWEEPRLREQDFGNFQPCSSEMERMWRERADYGHFFYRIPNGESAADAYDRVSGFNESLWRQFGDEDFPSVAVLVTHGLMTRVFLMKWYHWSVEYFEDLRNINHCEFIVMKRDDGNGKFILQNQLRTWSELKRQRAAEKAEEAERNPQRRNTLTAFLKKEQENVSPAIPARKWGGCVDGCEHHNDHYPRRTSATVPEVKLPPAVEQAEVEEAKISDHPASVERPDTGSDGTTEATPLSSFQPPTTTGTTESQPPLKQPSRDLPIRLASFLRPGRDGGGTASGANTPHEMSDDEDATSYFPNTDNGVQQPKAMASAVRRQPQRKATPEDIERWAQESGMGKGLRADALGDEPEEDGGMGGEVAVGGQDAVEEAEREDKSLRGSVY
ncbi:hypothetical protein LTR56_019701 [Elasticomyces elasticus]|nr:hypothetical protein LTR56_019701 [Elasticomyces elasticus]KAK4911103.1 hypothetical protein LTR49_020270 [Elasticomyces elasticus]KAK5750669.1 hypothetical protein LTS12_019290 [Elasticomyces elasticus]